MDIQAPLTISSVGMEHPTEILIELSDGTTLSLSVEEIQALQVKASGTKPTFERSGEP